MSFQWDSDNAQANLDNHEIDFSDTGGAFEDQWALTIKEDYVEDEQRFATLGMDFLGACAGSRLYLSSRRHSSHFSTPCHETVTENL